MSSPSDASGLNVCLLAGALSSPPEVRLLDSGTRLATLAVRVTGSGSRATSVPVAWWEPAPLAEELAEGDPVVVLGTVERRFFRTATGGAGSRVEVVAERVVRAADGRRLAALTRRVEQRLARDWHPEPIG